MEIKIVSYILFLLLQVVICYENGEKLNISGNNTLISLSPLSNCASGLQSCTMMSTLPRDVMTPCLSCLLSDSCVALLIQSQGFQAAGPVFGHEVVGEKHVRIRGRGYIRGK